MQKQMKDLPEQQLRFFHPEIRIDLDFIQVKTYNFYFNIERLGEMT